MIMSEKVFNSSGHDVVDKVINDRVNNARQTEVLGIYEELLQKVWDRIVPTLGRVTTVAIMERAIVLTKENYPIIADLEIGGNGLIVDKLREFAGGSDSDVIRDALKELVVNLIDILAMLTGDILVTQLIKEIEGRQA